MAALPSLGLFNKMLEAGERVLPGLARQCRERAVLTNALHLYRTPSNHHLRRALRLAWIRATTTLVNRRVVWAKKNPNNTQSQQVLAFLPAFNVSSIQLIRDACDYDMGRDLPESPIDPSLEFILNDLAAHLKNGAPTIGREAARDNFSKTLSSITHWPEVELPACILSDAIQGIGFGGSQEETEVRDFGQLLFDEFARVVQERSLYPEAAHSFDVVQQGAIKELLFEVRQQLQLLTSDVPQLQVQLKAQTPQQQTAVLNGEWVEQGLQSHATVLDKLDSLQHSMDEQFISVGKTIEDSTNTLLQAISGNQSQTAFLGGEQTEKTIESHQPSQSRTIMFAGSCKNADIAAVLSEVSDLVSRRALRAGRASAIDPVSWDFSYSMEREASSSEYTTTLCWETLDANVVGALLLIDQDLSSAISPDLAFVKSLDGLGLLAPTGPLVDATGMSAVELFKQMALGGLPITYETRFVVECVLRNIPIAIVQLHTHTQLAPEIINLHALAKHLNMPSMSVHDAYQGVRIDEAFGFISNEHIESIPNPFRGLDYYDVSDASVFVGRESQAKRARVFIEQSLSAKIGLALCVSGRSGSGKSSFTRAKIIADAYDEHRLRYQVFRPTDFHILGQARIRPLPKLCEALSEKLEVLAPDNLVGDNALFRDAHLPIFKSWLDKAIQLSPSPVLLCIDQFEEILDDIIEGVHVEDWLALFDILAYLRETHNWIIVFTLEDSRITRFDKLKTKLCLAEAEHIAIPNDDAHFYEAIITSPFLQHGIELDNAIVNKLLDEVSRLASESESSSVLPLLALRLFSLFYELQPRMVVEQDTSAIGRNFSRMLVRLEDIDANSLALDHMVADLAEAAWSKSGLTETEDLDFFLSPLIRLSLDVNADSADKANDKANDKTENKSKVPPANEAKLVLLAVKGRGFRNEQQLQASFKRNRLLVPSGEGLRLVHEAVIRRWPRANKWFEHRQIELRNEAKFRVDALRWYSQTDDTPHHATKDRIHLAATILSANLREWTNSDLSRLDEENQIIRGYALAVFEHSEEPERRIDTQARGLCHVHVAAGYGLNEQLQKFITLNPSCIHLPSTKSGGCALQFSAWLWPDTVSLLLNAGANAMHFDKRGFTAIDASIWGEQQEIFNLLLPHLEPDKYTADKMNPLNGAAARANLAFAEKLVLAGVSHTQEVLMGWTPLHQAACIDDLNTFKYFLERGSLQRVWEARDSEHCTVLDVASSHGCLNIVRYLLSTEEGYRLAQTPGQFGDTALIFAAWCLKYKTVAELIAVVDDPNSQHSQTSRKGNTALHHALIQYSHDKTAASRHLKQSTVRTVQALLVSNKADVMLKNGKGTTVWEMAAGLPELQHRISQHASFSNETLAQLMENQRVIDLVDFRRNLFNAAIADDMSEFDSIISQFNPGEEIDSLFKQGDNKRYISEVLIDNGRHEKLIELIRLKNTDPWRNEKPFMGLLVRASQHEKQNELVSVLLELFPSTLPQHQMLVLILNLGSALGGTLRVPVKNPDEFLERLLVMSDAATLIELARVAALRCELPLLNAVRRHLAPTVLDSWGRTAEDEAGNSLRAQLGLEEFGIDSGEFGSSVAHPADKGWSVIDDVNTIQLLQETPGGMHKKNWDSKMSVMGRDLPFYKDTKLVFAHHAYVVPKNTFHYWLVHNNNAYRLNGSAPVISSFNQLNPPLLNETLALEYAKFYMFFIRGSGGPFYIVDSVKAPYLPVELRKEDTQHSRHEEFVNKFRPPRYWGKNDSEGFRYSVLILYVDALSVSDVLVEKNGSVRVLDNWLAMVNLPTKILAPV